MPKFRIMIPRHDYYIVEAENKAEARRKLEEVEDRGDYFDDAEEDYDHMEIEEVNAPVFQMKEPFPEEAIRVLPA